MSKLQTYRYFMGCIAIVSIACLLPSLQAVFWSGKMTLTNITNPIAIFVSATLSTLALLEDWRRE